MDSIATSFDKTRINQCTSMCVVSFNNSRFTPDELNCFSRYPFAYLDVPKTLSATRTMAIESGPILTTWTPKLLAFEHNFNTWKVIINKIFSNFFQITKFSIYSELS